MKQKLSTAYKTANNPIEKIRSKQLRRQVYELINGIIISLDENPQKNNKK